MGCRQERRVPSARGWPLCRYGHGLAARWSRHGDPGAMARRDRVDVRSGRQGVLRAGRGPAAHRPDRRRVATLVPNMATSRGPGCHRTAGARWRVGVHAQHVLIAIAVNIERFSRQAPRENRDLHAFRQPSTDTWTSMESPPKGVARGFAGTSFVIPSKSRSKLP